MLKENPKKKAWEVEVSGGGSLHMGCMTVKFPCYNTRENVKAMDLQGNGEEGEKNG